MPSKLKAGGVFPYTLEADRTDSEPQFEIVVLSSEENESIGELRRQYLENKDGRNAYLDQMLGMAVKRCLIPGHENAKLRAILTDLECWELINAATAGAVLTPEERKKFGLQVKLETA